MKKKISMYFRDWVFQSFCYVDRFYLFIYWFVLIFFSRGGKPICFGFHVDGPEGFRVFRTLEEKAFNTRNANNPSFSDYFHCFIYSSRAFSARSFSVSQNLVFVFPFVLVLSVYCFSFVLSNFLWVFTGRDGVFSFWFYLFVCFWFFYFLFCVWL